MRMSSIPAHGREGKWDVVSHVAESLITCAVSNPRDVISGLLYSKKSMFFLMTHED